MHIIYILIILIIICVVYLFTLEEKEYFTQDIRPHNNSIYINPEISKSCKSIVQDFDEIDLDEIKKQDNKIDEEDIINNKQIKKLEKVTTFLESPWYKSFNLEDLNQYELAYNNTGLINYVSLGPKESFKPHNTLIR